MYILVPFGLSSGVSCSQTAKSSVPSTEKKHMARKIKMVIHHRIGAIRKNKGRKRLV